MLNIRKLSVKDLGQVLTISKSSFAEPWPKNEFEKHLNCSFAADDNGEIAGFAVGKISGSKAVLKLIAVNPDFRGKGIGKSLMEYILKYFAENGAKEVMARSRLHNEAGCAFLKSFGFDIKKIIKNYYRDGEDAYLMVKKMDG